MATNEHSQNEARIDVIYLEPSRTDAALVGKLLEVSRIVRTVDRFETVDEFVSGLSQLTYQLGIVGMQSVDSISETLIDRIRETAPTLPLIVLTTVVDERRRRQSLRAGAQAHLDKWHLSAESLADAIGRARARQVGALRTGADGLWDAKTRVLSRTGFNAIGEFYVRLAASQGAAIGLATFSYPLKRFDAGLAAEAAAAALRVTRASDLVGWIDDSVLSALTYDCEEVGVEGLAGRFREDWFSTHPGAGGDETPEIRFASHVSSSLSSLSDLLEQLGTQPTAGDRRTVANLRKKGAA